MQQVTPHMVQPVRKRSRAIDGRTTRHPDYAGSHQVEEGFGWLKTVACAARSSSVACVESVDDSTSLLRPTTVYGCEDSSWPWYEVFRPERTYHCALHPHSRSTVSLITKTPPVSDQAQK